MTAPPRYKPLHPLGTGGMGTVLACEDTERGGVVALKTLTDVDPLALSLFKNEFRSLADLAHPNLVALYELGQHEDKPFFTMEVVDDAVDLLKFVRGTDHASGRTWLSAMGDLDPDATLPPLQTAPEPTPVDLPLPSPLPEGAEAKLRDALGQLAEALATLHAHGKVHRDVKPSNVLVEPSGRVVLVDFGLVCSLDGVGGGLREVIAGSVPYMSPEQSIGADVGPASDWYAFGAVLYELLTGRPPFAGARAAVLAAKRGREVVPPQDVVPGVPEDLGALAVRLLRCTPTERPSGDEMLAAFGREVDAVNLPFVGRDDLLMALDAIAAEPGLRVVQVVGDSGIGKSALLEHWLARREDLIATSRCYEHDALPYKAIDPLVTTVARWGTEHPDLGRQLVPRYRADVLTSFPELGEVEGFAGGVQSPNPSDRRRRALTGIREVFARLAEHGRVTLWVDDLQWVDGDSLAAFAELTRDPDPPPVLLLLTTRPKGTARLVNLPITRVLSMTPLSDSHARGLLAERLDPELTRSVLDEAKGNPFYLAALASAAQRTGRSISLHRYLDTQVEALSDTAKSLLEVVALAGRPLIKSVAFACTNAREGELTMLKAMRLVSTAGGHGDTRVECAHDRVRETVVDALPAERQQLLHTELARALIRAEEAPASIAEHLVASGDERAGHYLRLAANEARDELAFDLEVHHLRQLLDRCEPRQRAALLEELARAVERSGGIGEAAELYEAAAKAGGGPSVLGQAAYVYLMSGQTVRGEAVARKALAELGTRLPRTRLGLWAGALWMLLTRWWWSTTAMPDREADAASRDRILVLVRIAFGFNGSDAAMGAYLSLRVIRDGLASRHPEGMLLAHSAMAFLAGLRRDFEGLQQSLEYTLRVEPSVRDEVTRFFAQGIQALAEIQVGRDTSPFFAEVDPELWIRFPIEWSYWHPIQTMLTAMRDGPGVVVEDDAIHLPTLRTNGHRRAEVQRVGCPVFLSALVLDDPALSEARLDTALASTPENASIQQFRLLLGRLRTAVYRQDPRAIRQYLDACRTRRRRGAARGGNLRLSADWHMCIAGLAVDVDRASLGVFADDLAELRTWSLGEAVRLQGLLAARHGHMAMATRHLTEAVGLQSEHGWHTFASITRWALAILGNDPSQRIEAETWLQARGVRNPARWAGYWNANLLDWIDEVRP